MGKERELVDFHFHSCLSDGTEDIPSIIREAKRKNVVAMALTDHNTGDGVIEFVRACEEARIRALEGVEVYAAFPITDWSLDPRFCGPVPDVVILGRELCWEKFQPYKDLLFEYWWGTWIPETLEKIRSAGFSVPHLTEAEAKVQAGYAVPPVFHQVVENSGNLFPLTRICQEEFEGTVTAEDIEKSPVRWADKYLWAVGKRAFVLRGPKEFGVEQAVQLARDMGGELFAAHPGGDYGNWTEEHLHHFVRCGGKGIEVWQYFHTAKQVNLFLQYAVRHNLLVSGGSDWHGNNEIQTLGCSRKPRVRTPLWVSDQLFERLP